MCTNNNSSVNVQKNYEESVDVKENIMKLKKIVKDKRRARMKAKMNKGEPKENKREPQKEPKRSKMEPKGSQKGVKMSQNGAKREPKDNQNVSKNQASEKVEKMMENKLTQA